MYQAYENIFKRMGLDFVVVEADAGDMASSDSKTHEFQITAETGEDELVLSASGYAANIEKAVTVRKNIEFDLSGESVKEVETIGKATIEEVSIFLKQPEHHSLKSLVYKGIKTDKNKEIETFYLIQLLGDDDLNELKLANFVCADELHPASEQELESLNLPKGYIGALGLTKE